MLNESIKKLQEKEEWDSKDIGMAIGIVMGRALKNSEQKSMASFNANKVLAATNYDELSDTFVNNFIGAYSLYLDRDADSDITFFCSRAILGMEDKIKAGEKMGIEVKQAIIAGYTML